MILTFLLICLINSIAINGVYLVTREGMLFGFIEKHYNVLCDIYQEHYRDSEVYINNTKWWWYPTFGCITCMSSFWSVMLFAAYWHEYFGIGWLPVLMLCSAYLNTLIYKINDRL